MSKKIYILILLIFVSLLTQSQISDVYVIEDNTGEQLTTLKVEQYKLENGLTVYLNEDHEQTNVYGGVIIKAGSKRDPKDATGIAHYLEHMMFKGTDKMGTIAYDSEKIYLDSINLLYEELGKAQTDEQKKIIQMNINRLSVKAAEFAIPNEFDKIMNDIGGTGVNAYTSEENIVYYNYFPGNQIEKWLEIYSHRFVNPVFRMFQSELETVYEEKNMSMDNFFVALFETFQKSFFKEFPYGQQTVLGDVEHLKNPSLIKMYEYFKTYYVANNMALILCGDFKSDEVKEMIKQKFGTWNSGEIPPLPVWKEAPFDGVERVKKRLTPVKVGILGYRTIPEGHADEKALELCNNLLSNSASTGLFDKLYMDNKIMGAGMSLYQFSDVGGTMVFFIPKIFGQSLKNAEKLVIAEIEKIKNGEFTDDQLNAIKINLKKYHEESLENMYRRPYLIINVFMQNKSWAEMLNYPKEIDKVTKSDIVKVANEYYGKDYLALYSKMGLPKKHKIKKPDYKHIEPQNSEKKSEFAASLEKIKEIKIEPKFIEFENDVRFNDIRENCHLYYSANPVNNIFNLNIKFGVGTHKIPMLDEASSFLSLIGCNEYTFEELSKELQNLGSSFYVNSSKDYFNISISGFDKNFQQTIIIIDELLMNMKADNSQLKKLVQDAKMGRKVERKDPGTVGRALMNYAIYKNQSPYINRLSVDEVKKLNSDTLIATIKKAMKYEAEIHYSGKLPMGVVSEIMNTDFHFSKNLIASESPITYLRDTVKENTIYILDDKKAIQSHIYCIIEGESLDERQRSIANAFNKYFGLDMSSIIFQEIREYKALAYSAYGYYSVPFRMNEIGYTRISMSTQADKTIEAIASLNELITKLPYKEERLETIKSSLLQSINSNRPTFRSMSYAVARWIKQGYQYDPRKDSYDIYENLNFDDIYSFYKQNLQNKPIIMTIVGDKERIDIEELKKFGKIIYVKKDDVFRD